MSEETGATARPFALPTGTVTFLLTDIEGSTAVWEHAADAMPPAIVRHYEILADAVARHGGVRPVEQGEGDSVVAAFSRASDAVAAALDAQLALVGERWSSGAALRVRMAIHTGEAQLRDEGNYFGPAIIRAARVRDVGHGGQILLSDVTAGLVVEAVPRDGELVDLGSVRLKDLGRPERIWQLTHPDLPGGFPPVRGLGSYSNNLPAQLSPLIGRTGPIAELGRLLERERLVTLTGSGGVGKTRLALAVAADAVDRYPGGVWFVDLSPTGGHETAARATLRALDVPETPSLSPNRQVVLELGALGPALVVLDNCEHTLDDAAWFAAEILTADSDTTVLATSRERLDLPGEVTWRVPSLATPTTTGPVPLEVLSQFDAVSLFVDRARRALPSFDIDEANASAIAQICARLDGIPLAIELAAARCRHLPVVRIVAGLDDRFGLLRDGSRVVMPRHRTLAASVEWSHDLLDRDEQRALRRVGVFAGPFELDAAEHLVSAPGDVDPIAVFDLMARLVDKSLVLLLDSDGSRDVRYRLLETIRAFARQRAGDADELTELRDVHAAWWRDRLRPGIGGPTDDLVAMVDKNLDDILEALDWAAHNDVALALDLVHGLSRPLHGAGRTRETLPVVERLLSPAVEATHPERWLSAAIPASVPMAAHLGRRVFLDVLERCETVATTLGLPYRLAVTRWLRDMTIETGSAMLAAAADSDDPSVGYIVALGTIRLAIDRALDAPEEADRTLTDAVRAADAYPSSYVRNYVLAATGVHGLLFGDLDETVRCGRQMLDDRSLAIRDWGKLFLLLGGTLTADREALESVSEAAGRERARGMPHAGTIGDYAQAMLDALAGESASLAPIVERFPHNDHFPILIAGRVALASDAVDEARAMTEAEVVTSPAMEVARLITMGSLDDDEDAWHEALLIASRCGYRPMAVDALEGLGVVAARGDSSTEALRLFGAAARLRDETGYRFRFAFEQRRHDDAVERARADLAGLAEAAWTEGYDLSLAAVTEYARRARGERKRPRHGWESLTPTELRVVELAAQGLTNPEIAGQLLMSRSTVKTHLEHVYAKTGVRNRSQLAAEAMRRATHDSDE